MDEVQLVYMVNRVRVLDLDVFRLVALGGFHLVDEKNYLGTVAIPPLLLNPIDPSSPMSWSADDQQASVQRPSPLGDHSMNCLPSLSLVTQWHLGLTPG